MDATHALLQQLIAQTQELLTLAASDQWDAFAELLAKRQTGIGELMASAPIQQPETLSAEAAAQLRQLQQLNEQLASSAQTRRESLVTELRQMGNAAKAINSYTS